VRNRKVDGRLDDGAAEGMETISIGSSDSDATGELKMHLKYGLDVAQHIQKVVFGPKAKGIEMFRKCLVHKGLDGIGCLRSSTHLA